jgi:hypothetical protein
MEGHHESRQHRRPREAWAPATRRAPRRIVKEVSPDDFPAAAAAALAACGSHVAGGGAVHDEVVAFYCEPVGDAQVAPMRLGISAAVPS